MESPEQLAEALSVLGYDPIPLSPALFQGTPTPSAVFEVTERDGRIRTVYVFRPEDYELLRNTIALGDGPEVGLTDGVRGAEDRNPAVSTSVRFSERVEPQLFRNEAVVVLFPHPQSYLYVDLERLLGPPDF